MIEWCLSFIKVILKEYFVVFKCVLKCILFIYMLDILSDVFKLRMLGMFYEYIFRIFFVLVYLNIVKKL